MKRIITFIAALTLGSSLLLSAQEKDRHHYDAGVGLNAYGILGSVGGPSRNNSLGFLFEYRYDYTDRVDFGAQALFKHSKGHSAFTGGVGNTPRRTVLNLRDTTARPFTKSLQKT